MTLPTLALGTVTPGIWSLLELTVKAVGKVPDGLTEPIKAYEKQAAALDKATAALAQTTVGLDEVLEPDLAERIARAAASNTLGTDQRYILAQLRASAGQKLVERVSLTDIYDLLSAAWVEAHEVLKEAPDYTEIPAGVYSKLSAKERDKYDAATLALQQVADICKAHDRYLRLKDNHIASQALGPAEDIFWSKYNPTAAEYRNAEGLIWSEVNNPSTITTATLAFVTAGITAELAETPADVVRRRAKFLDDVPAIRTLNALENALNH